MMNWFGNTQHSDESSSIKHRGPDLTSKLEHGPNTFVFHRLSINDLSDAGNQPIVKGDTIVVCNGEIYNHEVLRSTLAHGSYAGGSDCEVIAQMLHNGTNVHDICNSLDGVFAFIAARGDVVYAARDPIGVRPLFYGHSTVDNSMAFASEIKALQSFCTDVFEFPNGHYYDSTDDSFHMYHNVGLQPSQNIPYHPQTLRNILESSVSKRLMSDRPVAFFLSGGLDSSLIAAIGAKLLGKIHTFSIGIGESPDLKAARKVAKHIGSSHTEVMFTAEEGISAMKDVVYALESYDCTTIRASIPMFLLSRYVSKNTDFRVILSGEGADELFGGYLYFHNAPSACEFQKETLRLLNNVKSHDVLRADRCTAHHGLELRVPFFDREMLHYVTSIAGSSKTPVEGVEKYILRKAFDDDNLLPKEILWRQKNGMSDAVGYSWVDHVRQHADRHVNDDTSNEVFSKNLPLSKEELMYRRLYTSMYPLADVLPHVWRPKWTTETDPSAKLLSVFETN